MPDILHNGMLSCQAENQTASLNMLARVSGRVYRMSMKRAIGERMLQARKRRGMTQAELARRAGLTQATLSNYELGKREPEAETVKTIASILGESPGYLFFGEAALKREVETGALSKDAYDIVSGMALQEDVKQRAAHLLGAFLKMPPIFQEYVVRKASEALSYTTRLSPFVRDHLLKSIPEGESYQAWESAMEDEFRALFAATPTTLHKKHRK